MMGNYYLLNPAGGWAAVCISKNGCTSLKARTLMDHGIPANDFKTIHNRIGYAASSPFLRDVRDGIPEDLKTFAVWRDPVERFKSVFKNFALGESIGRQPASLPPVVDSWLDWLEDEMQKPILNQDEHIRRQCDYYCPEDVDAIIPLGSLTEWFNDKGFGKLPREHVRSVPLELIVPLRAL